MSEHTTPAPVVTPLDPPRVHLAADDHELAPVAALAAERLGLRLSPLDRLHAGAVLPDVEDVVLLPADDLPAGTLEAAARLAGYAPAPVLLTLPAAGGDAGHLARALRLGAVDVVHLPVAADELALRLDLARRRPRSSVTSAADVRDLVHQLTNVMAALRLTAYAVGRLAPAEPVGGGPTRPLLDGRALAERIEREVDQAVLLVAELDHRVQGAARGAGGGGGGKARSWA